MNRNWSVSTKSFDGDGKNVQSVKLKKIQWEKNDNGKYEIKELKGKDSEIILKADLVLLAMGFLHPKKDDFLKKEQK